MASREEAERRKQAIIEMRKTEKRIEENLKNIEYKIAIISGKGGVGKSTVSANLSIALALKGYKVGIMDSDFHGPSIPKMLGAENNFVVATPSKKLIPVEGPLGIKIMSILYFLQDHKAAVIWRGPLKKKFLDEVLASTMWGNLDFLIFDLPPGTGDDQLNLVQSVKDLAGLIAVTQPTDVSTLAVAKAIEFAKKTEVKVIGVIENMSYFKCPNCGEVYKIFSGDGGSYLSTSYNIPLLGRIPIDPRIAEYGDSGYGILINDPNSELTRIFSEIVDKIVSIIKEGQ